MRKSWFEAGAPIGPITVGRDSHWLAFVGADLVGADLMICRGGIVVGSWGDQPGNGARTSGQPVRTATRGGVHWGRLVTLWVIVSLLLTLLPSQSLIPPSVESDYCYQLLAADRLVEGQGFTSLQPVAPNQPWEWRRDWGFLTQWPPGYALLIAAIRWVTSCRAITACQWVNLVACAAALIGWFAWTRRTAPAGITGWCVALAAAAGSVSVGLLVDPSSDVIVVATLPWLLLLTVAPTEPRHYDRRNQAGALAATTPAQISSCRMAALGLLSGGLCWFRYAAVFVPFALFLHLIWSTKRSWPGRARATAPFCLAAAVTVGSLYLVNRLNTADASATAMFNLGNRVTFDLSWSLVSQAWARFTDMGYYKHIPISRIAFALWPAAGLIVGVWIWRRHRSEIPARVAQGIGLSAGVVLSGLLLLVGASALFGNKFNYIGLDRYYLPIKPLYFALFVAPLLCIPHRAFRAAVCVGAIVACSWTVRQEWKRTYDRWAAAKREVTDYGQWATCFSPGAAEVYRWLRGQASDDLVVVSNFHEYIALETGLATLPIPASGEQLVSWLQRIKLARELPDLRVLFVLDSSNRWRDYWIDPPDRVAARFALGQPLATNHGASVRVFAWPGEFDADSSSDHVANR